MTSFKTIGQIMLEGHGRVLVQAGRYPHGGQIAIVLTDAATFEPIATFSANLAAHGAEIKRNAFAVKDWSENVALVEPLRASGLFEDTGERIATGYILQLHQRDATGYVEAPVWTIKDPAHVPPLERRQDRSRR